MKTLTHFRSGLILLVAATTLSLTLDTASAITPDGKRKLVLIAGKPSHPPLEHEFRAGSILLEKCLQNVPNLVVDRHDNGWVKDESTFNDADAVVIYSDGGAKHPALQGSNLETLRKLIERGIGFGCMHYGVEVPVQNGGREFQQWLGGHYETHYSCNPKWEPKFESFPKHPITNGVKPFQIRDEWYFNMRFRPAFGDGTKAAKDKEATFTPLLVAVPTDEVRNGPYVYPPGPYPHIQAESGEPETMMWAVEREGGGRSFGFTGGHYHFNWKNDEFRKIVLNALAWVSQAAIPDEGISSTIADEELKLNLDPKPQPKPKTTGVFNDPGIRFRRNLTQASIR